MRDDIAINAVVFQEDGTWIIQGIEYDIAAHSEKLDDAPTVFMRALLENVCITQHLGKQPLQGIGPAPDRFRRMFEASVSEIRAVEPPPFPIPVPMTTIRVSA